MKKLFVFIGSAALMMATSSVFAQAQGPTGKAVKMGVVDMQRISQESLLGKGYATRMDQLESEIRSELTKRQNQIGQLDAAIKALQDDLQKQSAILSADAVEKKQQDIVKKNRERQALAEDSQADIQRMQQAAQQKAQEFQAEFNTKIQPILQAVGKEKGLDFILDRATLVLINDELDVTRDVVVKADDTEKAARPATAPKPAPAPAAPAPPAPAAPKPTPTPRQ
ncbi:MAG: OmpH family outer membrane protein [Vicinamibacteria bacterium]|nr:OmpH family outer membrane protein [Vicinamibacteria bacterium]